ncbi:hypothetical protein L198_02590 [Cryptococcus wingfieldii CBS 7118]|uniref:BTB domain-containing protein n=1 Tax=Cryptococcus wingfieldii CBS 7118 TaxID=1295528 RepID=A0A1E3JPM5_9TREE|nr:hypothetical protein L198_02590 [Cryptococcus wingfieldii CBS 7118]ODO01862.1 hypothetical protein L198_02590 [Cryptococcus wingfieldii CBS 7118]
MASTTNESSKKQKTRGDATSADLTPAASPVDPPLDERWSTNGDTLLVSSNGTGFLVERYMLKAHSSVFRDMLSSNDFLPSYSSSHSGRVRLDLPEDTENALTVSTVLWILDQTPALTAVVSKLRRKSIVVLDHVLHFSKKFDMPFLSNYLENLLGKALRQEDNANPDTDRRLSYGDIFILAARADMYDLTKTAIERIPHYFDQSLTAEYGSYLPEFTHWWHPGGDHNTVFPTYPATAFAATPSKYMWALMQVGGGRFRDKVRGEQFAQAGNSLRSSSLVTSLGARNLDVEWDS